MTFRSLAAAFLMMFTHSFAMAQQANLEFDDGTGRWSTVLDGVMGGRSTGRISQEEPGILRFTGELSLKNNGGFSSIRTSVPQGTFTGKEGLTFRVRGDGRRYQFDVRCSDVRLMAGGYQVKFDTKAGEWTTVEIPFREFRLFNFGEAVDNAPKLRPDRIESIGFTLADKKEGPFAIDVDWVRPLGGSNAQGAAPLAAVAEKAGLTTLLSLVKAAGLELPAGGRVTIFAPTNDAFAKLPKEKVEFLTSEKGKATLATILRHHVVASSLESPALLSRRRIVALSGQSLLIDADALTVGGAKIIATDVGFDGGIVHVIDTVLVPELRTIAEIASQEPRLSSLVKALAAADLTSQFGERNPGPWTVLAPVDEAFKALGDGAFKDLAANPDRLRAVLAAHVIPGAIRRSEMPAMGKARTLGGGGVRFSLDKGAVTAGGATIIVADIEAANGVIHLIDRVIKPEASTETMAAAQAVDPAKIASIIEAAIERGAPMFNAGDTAACAAIYEVAVMSIVELAGPSLPQASREALTEALETVRRERDASERAWTLRRAMDKVYARVSGGAN
jgi:transforming growth factor-beta-induced protein